MPIIVLEAAIGARRWNVPIRAALTSQALANGFSTLLGLPATWVMLAVVELICCGTALGLSSLWQRIYAVTIQAPWLIPYEGDLKWMTPLALVVLSGTFCVMSILCEFPIVKLMVGPEHKRRAWPWVVRANATSYSA